MWLEERVVAFLDILGVSAAVDLAARGKGESLHNVLWGVFHLNYQEDQPGREHLEHLLDCQSRDFQCSVFSDNVALSDIGDRAVLTVLVEAGWRAAAVLRDGLLCRGATVRGLATHASAILVGPAILDAYRLERSGLYPRIVIAADLAEEAFATSPLGYVPISQDNVGQWYLDIFDFLPKPRSRPGVWRCGEESFRTALMCAALPMDADVRQQVLAVLNKGRQHARTPEQAKKWTWLLEELEGYDARRMTRVERASGCLATHK